MPESSATQYEDEFDVFDDTAEPAQSRGGRVWLILLLVPGLFLLARMIFSHAT